jgi:ribosomal protein S6--L-glutamate ligase
MRIAILSGGSGWHVGDLERAAAQLGHAAVGLDFRQVSARLPGPGDSLAGYEAAVVRTMPAGSLEQVVFRMDLLGRAEAIGITVMNPPRAVEAAVDKFLATAKLQAAGLRVPKTIVCQTADDALAAFAELGGDVVIKPLFGSEGRGIARLQDEALALRAFRMLERLGAVLYVQEFIPHLGHDLRLLVIGQRILGMRRVNALDWRTNISRGAHGEAIEVTPKLAAMAHRAATALGAPLAGVDLLPARDGTLWAIEVNAVPGWKALSEVTQVDVAAMVLDFLDREVLPGASSHEATP